MGNYIMKKTGGKYPLFADGSGGYNQPIKDVPSPFLLDTYQADRAYSLRKLKSTADKSIRVVRTSDNTETDIGFVGNDLDENTLSSFCSGTTCRVVKFYDQSGNSKNADTLDASYGTIYESNSIIKINNKPAVFISQDNSSFSFDRLMNVNSIFFVMSKTGNFSTLNYLLRDSTSGEGISVYTNYWNPKLGTVYMTGGEFGRGLNFPSGQIVGSFVYSATASLYMINRNNESDTFGDQFGGSQTENTTLPRFSFNNIGRSTSILSIGGHLQEIILGASASGMIDLTTKDAVRTNINNYWTVY